MPKSAKSDSNLFAIDHAAIETILGDANAALIQRNTDLLAAFDRMPVSLTSEEDVIRAGRFVKQLKAAVRETAKARLSDGRPFADATATVKAFFQKYEESLKAALEVVLGRVTDAAVRARPAPDDDPDEGAAPVGIDMAGDAIVTAQSHHAAEPPLEEAQVELVWSVEAFDRATLDLEALRSHLTDTALLVACRRHLAAHGPHSLTGASYRQIAQPK